MRARGQSPEVGTIAQLAGLVLADARRPRKAIARASAVQQLLVVLGLVAADVGVVAGLLLAQARGDLELGRLPLVVEASFGIRHVERAEWPQVGRGLVVAVVQAPACGLRHPCAGGVAKEVLDRGLVLRAVAEAERLLQVDGRSAADLRHPRNVVVHGAYRLCRTSLAAAQMRGHEVHVAIGEVGGERRRRVRPTRCGAQPFGIDRADGIAQLADLRQADVAGVPDVALVRHIDVDVASADELGREGLNPG